MSLRTIYRVGLSLVAAMLCSTVAPGQNDSASRSVKGALVSARQSDQPVPECRRTG